MKKRLMALICAVVLCLCMIPAHAINAGDVYFTSVNDKLLPLSADTMPTWVSGRLYVPASVFDSAATGVDLGLYFRQNNNTVTLYTLRKMLVFDLNRGIAYDQHSGQNLSVRAVNRNSQIYLPVEAVCNFFELEDSYNYTQYGYLLRIKSEAAWLNDADFMDAASTPMSTGLQEFLRANPSQDTPSAPTVDPNRPQNPDDIPKNQSTVYLAVRCESGEGLGDVLSLLEQSNLHAIFFFRPDLLLTQDALVRRAVGSGHSIGLLAEGSTAEETRRLLTEGNRMLAHIARTAATAALVPADQRAALEQEGWVCWQQTTDGLPRENERSAAYAQRVLRAMGTRRTVYLTTNDSPRTARLLSALLEQFPQNGLRILPPAETRL